MTSSTNFHSLVLLVVVGFWSSCIHPASAQLNLAGGGYQARTNPANEADIALDAAAIKETDNLDEKKKIYNDGQTVSGKSLARLSLDASSIMSNDDMFNVFRYAFNYIGNVKEHEDLNHFDDKDVGEYGNTIVLDLFDLNQAHIETDAALATSVWMMVAHHLYEAMNECKSNASANGSDSLTGEESLDKAAAYWIGSEQSFGENERGHLLYSLTEKAGARFGQDNNLETEVNTNIIALMNQIKTDVIDTGACSNNDGYLEFRRLVNKIIAQMTIPLIQNLIHYSVEREEKFLELYALALLPQMSTCSMAEFDWFLEELVMKDLNQQDFDEVVRRLQNLYPCLGLTCRDVGSYKNGAVEECTDGRNLPDIAGYVPERDVSNILNIDRDILRIKILSSWTAHDAALDIYVNGRNSEQDGKLISLQSLATSNDRSVVPEYAWFQSYFNDANYADTIIMDALQGQSTYRSASADQRTEIVFRALQTLVMPMYSLQEMHKAVNDCQNDATRAEDAWDRGAAAYVGSTEGSEAGGTDSGVSLYGLANEMCKEFDTCESGSPGSTVNTQMIDFFQRGKTSLTDGSCAALPNPTLPASLIGDMKIVMIQGLLHFATVNDGLGAGSGDGGIGAGFSISRSILPYIDEVNKDAAATIANNMKFDSASKPVPDGQTAVYTAVANSLDQISIKCNDVGVHRGVSNGDLCALQRGDVRPDTPTAQRPTAPSGSPPTRPVSSPTKPPPVAEGGDVQYSYTTSGKDAGLIANDVKKMNEGSTAVAKTIYNNGGSSSLSLASLSLDASSRYRDDRLYNIFRFAFSDEELFIDGGSDSLSDSSYGDTVVAKALEIADDVELASHSSVVMNVWMEISHQLEQALASCTDSSIDGELAIDTAAANYIGAGQVKGKSDSGSLMYAIAEKSAERFGETSGEATSNTLIIKAFNDAKAAVGNCSRNQFALRQALDKIYAQLNVPLIRNLVYYTNAAASDDKNVYENYIELYALATVPQVAGCNPGAFAYLRDELIDYEWDSSDLPDILSKLRENLSCFGVTCGDIGILQDSVASEQLCGGRTDNSNSLYQPASAEGGGLSAIGLAKIDRDILQIKLLMQMGATSRATQIYTNGQNSMMPGEMGYYTLQNLATDDARNAANNDQFNTYNTYYNNPYYADSAIMDAFNKQGVFSRATDDQTSEYITEALRSMVTYMTGLQELYKAVDECTNGSLDDSEQSWDMGAAALIGSIDGGPQAEDYPSGGLLMYSLGNDVCDTFDLCRSSDPVNVGESSAKLTEALTGGKLFLKTKECDDALHLLEKSIKPALEVSLIQGTVDAASSLASNGSSDASRGSGHALMSAIVPLVDMANSNSARTIEDALKFDHSSSVRLNDIVSAFSSAIGDMDASCGDIGTTREAPDGFCPSGVVDVKTPVTLANGLYTTSTYVQDRSMIALDIRDMEKALSDGNYDVARGIYEGGLNSDIYDKHGEKVGTRSLASFSTSAPLVMSQEPTYIMFKYALDSVPSDNRLFMGGSTGEYADSIVQAAFASQRDPMLPVEAALSLNLWMYVVHELYQAVDNCRRKVLKDDDGVHSIDEVAAYYIGDSQQTGSAEQGHSLYAFAEKIGETFGEDNNGQVTVNIRIIDLLNEAKNEISYPGACTTNPETYKRLRTSAHKIIAQMTVPLIQNLIFNLATNDRERVKLYAQAFVPLTAACSPSQFEFLRDKLMLDEYNVVDIDNIIRVIESTYQCLGLECQDIGNYNDYGRDCLGTPEFNPMAGYIPQTDVRKIAALDLDIQSISIFMKERAYDAVKDYYSLGRHASYKTRLGDEVFSLKDLATTSSRQIVPSFEFFRNYFEAEVDEVANAAEYADHIISAALDTSTWPLASPEQRTEIVVKTSQYMIVYMAALEAMYEAIDDCESNDSQRNENAANEWDKAAAFLIGSLEETESGGTKRGLMMYSLANKRCEQFNRCERDGTAQLNGQLIELLYSGRGETMGRNCDALKKTTREVEAILQVPLIQGTLRYAIANERLMFFDKSKDLAEGYVFSHSVLPYVSEVDGEAAQTIKRNMDFQFDTEPVVDGTRKVFDAFASAIPRMGVDCEDVGSVDGFGGVCGTSASSQSHRSRLPLFASVAISGFVALLSLL